MPTIQSVLSQQSPQQTAFAIANLTGEGQSLIKRRPRWRRWGASVAAIALLLLILHIPVSIALTRWAFPQPQAILMLGGSPDREVFTAQFARVYPELEVWVSSGMPDRRETFRLSGRVEGDTLYFDDRATDTLTHFTTLLRPFRDRGIRHTYLLTSDFHLRRAVAIATLIFGSRGIIVTPVAIPSRTPQESLWKTVRDVGRSLIWLGTGWDSAGLKG